MNLIMDKAPTDVLICGKKVPIKADFVTCMNFEKMILTDSISDTDKLSNALNMFYGEREFTQEELEDAVEGILFIYTCGDGDTENKKGNSPGKNNRIYDYEYDADYIYAAYKQQYGEDLQAHLNMHWWKFKSMFKALSNDTEFVKIMGYRSITINSDMTKSQKDFYTKMKRIHALPLPADEQKKLDAIEEVLMNGGDLTGLMKELHGKM